MGLWCKTPLVLDLEKKNIQYIHIYITDTQANGADMRLDRHSAFTSRNFTIHHEAMWMLVLRYQMWGSYQRKPNKVLSSCSKLKHLKSYHFLEELSACAHFLENFCSFSEVSDVTETKNGLARAQIYHIFESEAGWD